MKKTFDAMKMVRDIRDAFYKKTRKMTDQEKIEYHHQQADELYKELKIRKNLSRS